MMLTIKKSILTAATLSLIAVWSTNTSAVIVKTTDGNGLDGEALEQSNEEGFPPSIVFSEAFDADDDDMNSRFTMSDRNELVVVRFDLSGVDKSLIVDASLNFIFNRTSSNNHKEHTIWGVSPDAPGFDSLTETDGSFDDVPGLNSDGDAATRSVVADETAFLGTFQFPKQEDDSDAPAGSLATIDQDLLDTTGPDLVDVIDNEAATSIEGTIVQYLQSLGTDDSAMFLIGGNGSGGQLRFVTKEAGGEAGAPFLDFTLIPEPASVMLTGIGAVAVAVRRRKA